MDSPIVYPSLDPPSPQFPPSDPGHKILQYPDPVSIDSITEDLAKSQVVSPSNASETVLINVPDAMAHLIDRQNSVLLATGPFSLVRLSQGENGIAVFARVGKELQWPLTKDQVSVKVDTFHYFFSLVVPPEIEAECRSSEEEKAASDHSTTENILNYGITFSPSSDVASLCLLDEMLSQYSHFNAPQVRAGNSEISVESSSADGEEKDLVTKLATGFGDYAPEDGSAEYWTLLAPNVEDYSSSIARAIAAGAGHIIRGIFWVSDATVAQLEKGNLYMRGKLKPQETPTQVSPDTMRRIRRARRISAMCEKVAGGVLSGVLNAAAFITRPFVTSKVGQKLFSLLPGQIALASLDSFGKIFDALEIAGKNVLTTTSVATTGLVTQRYGNEAGELTQEGLNAAGGFLTTAWTVSKLRKVFYPSSIMKTAIKVAGSEQKLKANGNKDLKD